MATIYRARADASRVKIRANLFCLLFSAFVSVWLSTPNIWGKRRLERHDSGGSDTAQGARNEQPVDKMWVSCARSGRSPRRFGAARCSDEMRARRRFRMPGDAQAKTLYVVFCQRRIYCVLQPARLDFDGAGRRDGLLLSAGLGAAMCQPAKRPHPAQLPSFLPSRAPSGACQPLPSGYALALQCRPVSREGAWWIKSLGTS